MNKSPFDEKSEISTILVVTNLSISKDFYIQVLGAELFREYGGNSAVIKLLGNWLVLVTAGGPTDDKPDIYMEPPNNATEVSYSFTIRLKDCM